MLVVQKFGGTSVDRPEHRALAARKVIQAREAGFAPVVVVSAIGRAGAKNAALLAVAILANKRPDLREKLHRFRAEQKQKVMNETLA